MKCHLYDAAGNRVLWLDARACGFETDLAQQRRIGAELSRSFHLGQEITAVLFGLAQSPRVLFWNPDGTYEAICGNAIRCLAHFMGNGPAANDVISVDTPSARYLSRKVDATHGSVTIPNSTVRVTLLGENDDILVDVGTPHRIRLVDEEWPTRDLTDAMAYSRGPDPVNFSLVRKVARNHYRVRVFERGVGETFSCGTAAVSIVAGLESPCDPLEARKHHRIEFASGEELTVCQDSFTRAYEIGGRVELLRDLST